MNTKTLRIDMMTVDDLNAAIDKTCDDQLALGFKLKASFVWNTDLILIFQNQ